MPIYRQIVSQIKFLIASGQLTAGEELPPIRTLAEQLVVNPNTIVKAYGELESEGMVFTRRGAGTYVSDVPSPLTRKEQRRVLSERINVLLAEASRLNVSFEDLQGLLATQHDKMHSKSPSSPPKSGKRHVR